MTDIAKTFILLLIILALCAIAVELYAKEPPMPKLYDRIPDFVKTDCGKSDLWECRIKDYNGMRCVFKYCVDPPSGKTVESAGDLWAIYCLNPT